MKTFFEIKKTYSKVRIFVALSILIISSFVVLNCLIFNNRKIKAITSDTAATTYVIGDSLTNSANGYGNYATHSQHLITNLLEGNSSNIDSADGRKFSQGITILSGLTDHSIKYLIFQVSLNNCTGVACKEAPVSQSDLQTVYNLATDGRFNRDIHIFFLTGYRPVDSASYSDFQALSHNSTMRTFAAAHDDVDIIDYSAALETIVANYGRTTTGSTTPCTDTYSPSDTQPLACYAQTNGHPTLKGSRLLAYLYNEALMEAEPEPEPEEPEITPLYLYYNLDSADSSAIVPESCTPTVLNGSCSVSITSEIPVKEGFTFFNWSEDEDADFGNILSEATITLSSNKTIYPIWADGSIELETNQYKINQDKDFVIIINYPLPAFQDIKMDGEDVLYSNYKATTGSTVITLFKEYLDTLETGNHNLTAVFANNLSVDTNIIITSVEPKPEPEPNPEPESESKEDAEFTPKSNSDESKISQKIPDTGTVTNSEQPLYSSFIIIPSLIILILFIISKTKKYY